MLFFVCVFFLLFVYRFSVQSWFSCSQSNCSSKSENKQTNAACMLISQLMWSNVHMYVYIYVCVIHKSTQISTESGNCPVKKITNHKLTKRFGRKECLTHNLELHPKENKTTKKGNNKNKVEACNPTKQRPPHNCAIINWSE